MAARNPRKVSGGGMTDVLFIVRGSQRSCPIFRAGKKRLGAQACRKSRRIDAQCRKAGTCGSRRVSRKQRGNKMSAVLPSRRPLDENPIVAGIARSYGYSIGDLKSEIRYHRLVTCRWRIFHALRCSGWTLCEIAEAFNRKHPTVLHGIRQWQKLIDSNTTNKETTPCTY